MTSRRLVGRIAFETPAGALFGDTRIRLLEAIVRHGSLNRAAKAVPLSYKAAWDALDAMNNLSPQPLVIRTTGGRHGGGTRLTEHGEQLIALYRAMESSQQDILDRVATLDTQPAAATGPDGAPLRTLIRRLAMKTSARNQFIGRVASIADTGGMAEVTLALDGGADTLRASITHESVETMGLAPGAQAYALIKAPWVRVSEKRPRPHGALNAYEGVITELRRGSAHTQLQLTAPSGRTLAATMPAAEVERRGLRRRQTAWASFAPDSVILVSFE